MNYQKLKVAELKTILKDRGLPVSGIKKDLIGRLEASDVVLSGKGVAYIDTETSGLIEKVSVYPNPTDLKRYDNSRLLELGYIIGDKEKSLLVKVDFPIKNSDIHGITNEMTNNEGHPIGDILDEFYNDLVGIKDFFAYNVAFDYNILASEAYRASHMKLFYYLVAMNKVCCMKMASMMFGYQKLSTLHMLLFDEPAEDCHRALGDVKTMIKCKEALDNPKVIPNVECKMTLPPISDEQMKICEVDNAIIIAVAGSGKTTTAFHIAKHNEGKKVLCLVYNTRLRKETMQRASDNNINMEIHTYHSFCYKYFGKCTRDKDIENLLNEELEFPEYDIVIIDEVQDMTRTYFELCKRICESVKKLYLMGDPRQCIFEFNGADSRYLMFAEKLFVRKFEILTLSISYRLTDKTGDFINEVLLRRKHFYTKKTGALPQYYVINPYKASPIIVGLLKKYKPDEIFLLAGSIRSPKSPVRVVENRLSQMGILVYTPKEDEVLDPRVIKDKLVITTFHQTKGLERKVVVLFGFDSSYYEFFAKDASKEYCPNILYVAASRASEQLIMLQSDSHKALPFISDNIEKYCVYVGNDKICKEKISLKPEKKSYTLKDLLRFLPSHSLSKYMKCLDTTIEYPERMGLKLIRVVEQSSSFEYVHDINTIAITSYIEYIHTGRICRMSEVNYEKIDESYENIFRYANDYIYKISGYKNRTTQLTSYDWVNKDVLDKIYTRTKEDLEFEKAEKIQYDKNGVYQSGDYSILFSTPLKLDETIYGFSLSENIEDLEILMLAFVAFFNGKSSARLYNPLTPSLVEIEFVKTEILYCLEDLLFSKNESKSDEEFLNEHI